MKTQRLHELLEYRDGMLFWKVGGRGIRKGKRAGSRANDGYRQIMIDKQRFLEHRVIFAMHHGYFPEDPMTVDHINRDRSDNRIENLREADKFEQQHNASCFGASFDKTNGTWVSSVKRHGKKINLPRNVCLGKILKQRKELVHAHTAY